MFSTLFDQLLQHALPVFGGVVLTLIFKRFLSRDVHSKIREYQIDIVKSRSKILQLEAKNEELKKMIDEREVSVVKDRLFLN